MRTIYLSIYLVTAFASLASAQLNLTVYRNPNLSDSVTLRWQQPDNAIPPVTYILLSGHTFNTIAPIDTLVDLTSIVLRSELTIAPLFHNTRFYSLHATDSAGNIYNSNTCGTYAFIAVGSAAHVSTPFGVPLMTWQVINGVPRYGHPSSDPADILGDQLWCAPGWYGNRILRQDNGQFAIRNENQACAWTGLLQINHNMAAARAYWYQSSYGTNRLIILCGEADTTTQSPAVVIKGGSPSSSVGTPYSWRDSRVINAASLSLFSLSQCEGLAFSDRILAQVGGSYLYYRFSDGTWQGPLREVQPGQAYWIQRRCPSNYSYIYDPTNP